MTSFVAWIGVDSRGPASIHLASDSRISWGEKIGWDRGQKIFACAASADLFGYVGDVLFPSLILGQLTSALDAGMCKDVESTDDRSNIITDQLTRSFVDYPGVAKNSFNIVHGSRQGEGMVGKFVLEVFSWSACDGWDIHRLDMPETSSALWISGTGGPAIKEWRSRWDSSSQGSTSRAVFAAFCDALDGKSDPRSGGGPQLASLYRKGPGRSMGCFFGGVPYLYGMPLANEAHQMEVEWRNELFERCDSKGVLLAGAQKHHAPKGLGRARGARPMGP